MGTKVRFKDRGKGGVLEVSYYSRDDFERDPGTAQKRGFLKYPDEKTLFLHPYLSCYQPLFFPVIHRPRPLLSGAESLETDFQKVAQAIGPAVINTVRNAWSKDNTPGRHLE